MPHTCGTGSSSPNEENISVPLCNGEAEIKKKMLEDHPRANPLFASAGSRIFFVLLRTLQLNVQ